MGRDHAIDLIGRTRAGEIENSGAGFQTGAGRGGLIRFHGKKETLRSQFTKNRKENAILGFSVGAGRVGEGGFGAEVDQMGAFRAKAVDALDRGGGGENDAFAIPGIGAEVDHAHEVRSFGGTKGVPLEAEFADLRR